MSKGMRYQDYLRKFIFVIILLNILNTVSDPERKTLLSLILYAAIVINDEVRIRRLKAAGKYYTSLTMAVIFSAVLTNLVGGYTEVYMYMLIYEIILFCSGKYARFLLGAEMFIMISMFLSRQFLRSFGSSTINVKHLFFSVIELSAFLLFYCMSIYSYKSLSIEKRKVEQLNKDLEQSYEILSEQAKSIEILTIIKERNRVAQEIHDSLGHDLVALNMNLDVAEKLIHIESDKSRELLKKAQILTKESMNNLRKAVYTLKDNPEGTLRNLIENMVDNIESAGIVKVKFGMDEETEKINLEYRELIYRIIREGLTNSIRHGKVDKINIAIHLTENIVYISIQDNGIGCDNIIKGNGLLNLEERIESVGGTISYNAKEGFNLQIEFPLNSCEYSGLNSVEIGH